MSNLLLQFICLLPRSVFEATHLSVVDGVGLHHLLAVLEDRVGVGLANEVTLDEFVGLDQVYAEEVLALGLLLDRGWLDRAVGHQVHTDQDLARLDARALGLGLVSHGKHQHYSNSPTVCTRVQAKVSEKPFRTFFC